MSYTNTQIVDFTHFVITPHGGGGRISLSFPAGYEDERAKC